MQIKRIHFASIDSTNSWAKHNAHAFSPEALTLITAEEQMAGRGRFQQKWVSPPKKNIYATFCFFVSKEFSQVGNIPQILALSAAKTLENFGFSPKLKWPNDILISNKKVAGILCETAMTHEQKCIVAGIGLNVNMPQEFLKSISQPATSLLLEGGRVLSIEGVLLQLQETFSNDLTVFLKEGFNSFLPQYVKRLMHQTGEAISFHDNRILWKGIFHSVHSDGTLNIVLDGVIKNFVSGEVL